MTNSVRSVEKEVNLFYNKNPFPGFNLYKYHSPLDLVKQSTWYARLLDALIPSTASVLDAGCGTGQQSMYLSLKGRPVLGVDLSDGSLAKANELKERLKLADVRFEKQSLLDLKLPDHTFDYVICHGVLHHTPDPYRGFQHLVRVLKPKGYLVLGLYNNYGRIWLKIKRFFLEWRNTHTEREVDWAIRDQLVYEEADREKKQTWYFDQYRHPYESVHSVGEVMSWFRKNGLRYCQGLPSVEFFGRNERFLFDEARRSALVNNRLVYTLKQLGWIFSLAQCGGYFVLAARKD